MRIQSRHFMMLYYVILKQVCTLCFFKLVINGIVAFNAVDCDFPYADAAGRIYRLYDNCFFAVNKSDEIFFGSSSEIEPIALYVFRISLVELNLVVHAMVIIFVIAVCNYEIVCCAYNVCCSLCRREVVELIKLIILVSSTVLEAAAYYVKEQIYTAFVRFFVKLVYFTEKCLIIHFLYTFEYKFYFSHTFPS